MRYSAFISYNHRDERWARWLHRELERYRLPKKLKDRETAVGRVADRLPPVFRDRDELAASADLGEAVKAALADAATLIVLCSPAAVASRWVNEEIRTFRRLGRQHRIHCLIIEGEPHAADPNLECLPPALSEDGAAEPLAADVRPGQDGKRGAKLKLIASILGVPYDDLRQRDAARRQRRLATLAAASFASFIVMAGLSIFAFISRAEAVEQRDLARQRTLTAERTVDFVKSMFEVSDPSEARGETITAREILAMGARRLDEGLSSEPAVKAELGVTLGEVYQSLGLFRDGEKLIRKSLAIPHGQPAIRARQLLALGDVQFDAGNYAAAVSSFTKAIQLGRRTSSSNLLPRMLVALGEAQSALGESEAADRSVREALRMDLASFGPRHPDVARDLEALGINYFYDGRLEEAKPLIERALLVRRQTEGPNSPSVSDNLNTLAGIAYLSGDSQRAEAYYRSRLQIDERVLGPEHPDVAGTLNSLARILVERRRFDEALPMLERAVSITSRERGELHDDMAFMFANLALAKRGKGEMGEAEALLEKAVRVARAHEHRTLAPNLTDLADVRCRRGRGAEAIAMLHEARPIMAVTYPDDPWRTAWTDSVLGECLLRQRRQTEAAALLRSSGAILSKRWKPGTLYRYESDRRLRMLRQSET